MAAAFLATMVLPLTDQQRVILDGIASELRFLLAENEVPDQVQIRMHALGYKTMQMFSVIADTRNQVREIVTRDVIDATEHGLTPVEVQQARLISNQLVACWLVASQRLIEEIRIGADNRALRLPMVLTKPALLSLRQRYETEKGRTSDHFYPCSTLIERVLEEIEEGSFTALPLSEIIAIEDSKEETTSIQELGTAIRVRKSSKPIPLPQNTEQLRSRFKTLGIVYHLARYKHASRLWLRTSSAEIWLEYCEWLLSEDVYGFKLDNDGLAIQTSWSTMLQYDLHIRKLTCRKVLFEQADFATALNAAKDDVQLRARWFITPTAILASTSSSSKRPGADISALPQDGIAPLSKKKQKVLAWKDLKASNKGGGGGKGGGTAGGSAGSNGKGGGKGNKKKGGQFKKTPDGRLICNFFNSSAGCARQGCTFVHICSKCYAADHNFMQCNAH